MTRPSVEPIPEWQVEDDLRMMIEAKKIEDDPKRMKAVLKLAEKKRDAMSEILEDSEEEAAEKE